MNSTHASVRSMRVGSRVDRTGGPPTPHAHASGTFYQGGGAPQGSGTCGAKVQADWRVGPRVGTRTVHAAARRKGRARMDGDTATRACAERVLFAGPLVPSLTSAREEVERGRATATLSLPLSVRPSSDRAADAVRVDHHLHTRTPHKRITNAGGGVASCAASLGCFALNCEIGY